LFLPAHLSPSPAQPGLPLCGSGSGSSSERSSGSSCPSCPSLPRQDSPKVESNRVLTRVGHVHDRFHSCLTSHLRSSPTDSFRSVLVSLLYSLVNTRKETSNSREPRPRKTQVLGSLWLADWPCLFPPASPCSSPVPALVSLQHEPPVAISHNPALALFSL